MGRGKSLNALRHEKLGQGKHAIAMAAGPSLYKIKAIEQIIANKYKGAIIITESALYYCLRSGIVPDLVISCDPHHTRIVRWFGDPNLSKEIIEADDYYERQDMDPAFADQLKTNEKIFELLNLHGKNMRIALATSSSQAVVQRVLETGMEIFWWNPMYDDPEIPDGLTQQAYKMNKLPCLNAGGNVGTACWVFADIVLNKDFVAITGMDLSYYDGTPYRSTQKYYELVNLVGEENLDKIHTRIFNPHVKKWFYTDPTFLWYRNVLLEMAETSECVTYNCTEGGILFGGKIKSIRLSQFLNNQI